MKIKRETDRAEFVVDGKFAVDHESAPCAFLGFQQIAELGEKLLGRRYRQPRKIGVGDIFGMGEAIGRLVIAAAIGVARLSRGPMAIDGLRQRVGYGRSRERGRPAIGASMAPVTAERLDIFVIMVDLSA